jgi:dihydroorotase
MELLIKNVTIVDHSQTVYGDIFIQNGKIKDIRSGLSADCHTIDGTGLTLMPSFIDLHAHFRDPGYTYKEDIQSGAMAAVKGGYTYVSLMANTNPVCSTMDTVRYVIAKAEKTGIIDVHQCISITNGMDGKTLSHLNSIETELVKMISDDGKGITNNITMYKAMTIAKEMGLIINSHVEDKEIAEIDSRLSENLMTIRDIELAKTTGCRLHIDHVSTSQAMEAIVQAKQKGYGNITCEVTPHHLLLTDDTDYTVNPPLRKKEDTAFLINALKNGFVDAIATDHAPHSSEDKRKGSPGISGIETAFSVCFTVLVQTGHVTLNKLSELMSKTPATIMGLCKGEIKIGNVADLVLVDINKQITVDPDTFSSKGKNTPLGGRKLSGEICMTVKSGRIVYEKKRN